MVYCYAPSSHCNDISHNERYCFFSRTLFPSKDSKALNQWFAKRAPRIPRDPLETRNAYIITYNRENI